MQRDIEPDDTSSMFYRSVKGPSPEVLEVRRQSWRDQVVELTHCPQLLLEHDDTDVDPQDKLDGNTPLHYAVRLGHPEARSWMVKTLLEAGTCSRATACLHNADATTHTGADPNIVNKYKQKPVDFLPKDSELRKDLYAGGICLRSNFQLTTSSLQRSSRS